MTIDDTVRELFEKSEILYRNSVISKETLIHIYATYLSETINKSEHNVGLVMHPGSVCFDVVSVVISGIMNFAQNEMDSRELIESLSLGDIVIYEKGRWIFSEIIDGGTIDKNLKGIKHVVLNQERTTKYGSSSTAYVNENYWGKIIPYNGKSKLTNGRGIRKKSTTRDDFFKYVLGYAEENIPNVIDTSSVIVMPRSRADDLVNNISFSFCKGKIKLLELITASYYSEEEEYSYSGNAGKNEPVLKFCSKISVARKQILSRNGNRHIGIMVMGQDTIDRSQSELPELIGRKSLKYLYLCTTMDSGYGTEMLNENQNINLFACTKEFLCEQQLLDVQETNDYTLDLNRRINSITKNEVLSVLIDGFPLGPNEELEFKNNLLKIKRNEYESTEKEEFVMQAFSLMNMFKTAAFSMDEVEQVCKNDNLSVETPSEKLNKLEEIKNFFPNIIKEESNSVLAYLQSAYESLQWVNPKKTWLELYFSVNREKKLAVVVPRAYYISVLRDRTCFSPVLLKNITFVTAGRFDASQTYDEIILLGDYNGRHFDAFRCSSANTIVGLFYEAEIHKFQLRKQKKEQDDYLLNTKSTIKISDIKAVEPIESAEKLGYTEIIDRELNDYFEKNVSIYDVRIKGDTREGRANLSTEIVAVATLEDERKVFFSKHYKAYVFDSDSGVTKEVETQDLCEGDSVVFTKNNDNTKDIVDSMLQQLIEDEKLSEKTVNSYDMSREWKQSLRNYMIDNELTIVEVANRLIELGAPVQPYTIMRWIDEDAHIVGPKNELSLKLIGQLTGNVKLSENYKSYHLACKEIRSIRRSLLGQIGEAIINKLNGKKPISGMISEIYDKIDDLSEVLQIERIFFTEKIMPLTMANRPINMRGDK